MAVITLYLRERTAPNQWSALAGGDLVYQSADYRSVYLAAEAGIAWARAYQDPDYDSIIVKLDRDGDARHWIDLHFERRE